MARVNEKLEELIDEFGFEAVRDALDEYEDDELGIDGDDSDDDSDDWDDEADEPDA